MSMPLWFQTEMAFLIGSRSFLSLLSTLITAGFPAQCQGKVLNLGTAVGASNGVTTVPACEGSPAPADARSRAQAAL